MARVWADSKHSGTELLMLLALADFSDDDGRAYPSVAGLAAKCRMKPRNANYILANLQSSGELRVRHNEGPKGKNLYQIVFAAMGRGLQPSAALQGNPGVQPAAGVQSGAGLHSIAQTPAMECAKPLQPIAAEPSLNHQEPSVGTDVPRRIGRKRGHGSKRANSDDTDFLTWLERVKANGEKPVPADDAIFKYAKDVGIPNEFLHLAWQEFRFAYTQPGAKRYKDWRAVFRKAVRGNWLKLWWIDGDTYCLTTVGKQAERAHQDRIAA